MSGSRRARVKRVCAVELRVGVVEIERAIEESREYVSRGERARYELWEDG